LIRLNQAFIGVTSFRAELDLKTFHPSYLRICILEIFALPYWKPFVEKYLQHQIYIIV